MLIFVPFALLLTYFGWVSLRGGFRYLDYFRCELARPASEFAPFATVFAPCRGLDADLEANLGRLFDQDYPRWEVIFVVDSESDAAVPVIRRLIETRAGDCVSARLVVAGTAVDESQKVHNLRVAASATSDESEVFVYVDSDARPSRDWLQALVAPLADPANGAATGYRWFVGKSFGLATELRSVWNASIASALGPDKSGNFCWGGSTAVRREVFERIGMAERWRGTLSDDFAVTRAMKANGLAIHFVPRALAASVEDCTFRECLEFTTRQMKITRVYAQKLWILAMLGAVVFNLVWWWSVANLFLYAPTSPMFVASAATLFANGALGAGKAYLRLRAVRIVLTEHEPALARQMWTQNTLWVFTPLIFLFNCIAAALSREIVWRGIRYRLVSPERTEVKRLD